MAEPAQTDNTPLIPFSSVPAMQMAEVITLAEVVAKRAAKFGAMVDSLNADITARGEQAAASLRAADFAKELVEQAGAKAATKARTAILADSSDARWAEVKAIVATAENLATTESLWANPVTVLARAGLGHPDRTHFQQQLSGAGPVELRQMAEYAVSTSNKVLGAALLALNDRLPRRDRAFSSAELAERLVGPETKAMRDAIYNIRTAVQGVVNKNRALVAGKGNPLDTIKMGLRARNKED